MAVFRRFLAVANGGDELGVVTACGGSGASSGGSIEKVFPLPLSLSLNFWFIFLAGKQAAGAGEMGFKVHTLGFFDWAFGNRYGFSWLTNSETEIGSLQVHRLLVQARPGSKSWTAATISWTLTTIECPMGNDLFFFAFWNWNYVRLGFLVKWMMDMHGDVSSTSRYRPLIMCHLVVWSQSFLMFSCSYSQCFPRKSCET